MAPMRLVVPWRRLVRESPPPYPLIAKPMRARGVLYAANNLGVLEYDGATWRLIVTVNHISRALVAQLEFDALVHLVGEQMRETFQASIVYVALHNQATDLIHFPYEYGDKKRTPSESSACRVRRKKGGSTRTTCACSPRLPPTSV